MNKVPTFKDNEICVISDIHLGVHQSISMWHDIAINFAKWLKDQLNAKGIKDIVIAGDIFHDRNEVSVLTMHIATEFFKILKDFNIVILVGNHDAYYRDRSDVNSIDIFHAWDNISIVNNITTIEAFDKKITFVPWAAKLVDIPQSDLIFGHFEITSFKLNKNKICSHGLNSVDLLNKAPLIITGHFHYRDERNYSNGKILYTGNPFQMDWSDCNTVKGIHLLDLKTMKYDFIVNNVSPKHIKFRLSEVLNIETGMIETLKLEAPGNIINFIIDKDISVDKIDALINKLSSLQPLQIKTEFFDSKQFNTEDLNYEFTGINIGEAIEEFVKMLEVKNKEDVLAFTLDLYNRVH